MIRAVVSTRSARVMPSCSSSRWNAAMRSISATSAALAATGDISPTTRPAARDSAILAVKLDHEGAQRAVPHVAEALVALLRGEVARAQHGPVAIPVVDEAVDERARVVEPAVGVPRRLEPRDQRRDLVADLLGEREHGFLDVAEVLVEGRGRRADRAMSTTRRSRIPCVSSNSAVASSRRRRVCAPRRPSARPSSATVGSITVSRAERSPRRRSRRSQAGSRRARAVRRAPAPDRASAAPRSFARPPRRDRPRPRRTGRAR